MIREASAHSKDSLQNRIKLQASAIPEHCTAALSWALREIERGASLARRVLQYLVTVLFSALYTMSCVLIPLGIILTGKFPSFSFQQEGPAMFTIGYIIFVIVSCLAAMNQFYPFTALVLKSSAKKPLCLHLLLCVLLTVVHPITTVLAGLYVITRAPAVTETLSFWRFGSKSRTTTPS